MIQLPELWFGDHDSLARVHEAYQYSLNPPEGVAGRFGGEVVEKEDDESDELLDFLVDSIVQYRGNVGIVNVDGPLVNGDSFFNAFFGMTSYNTISAALQRMLDDSTVTKIVMNYATRGGDANGIEGASTNLEAVSKLKPLYSYVSSGALSAGYWLAAHGRKIIGSKMSEVGSIGVVTTFTSYARALEREGVDVHVVRGGKYKALAHPAEKLSREAEDYLEERTQAMYGFFLDQVVAHRPVTMDTKDAWAEGRVFFLDQGIKVNLADASMDYHTFINRLRSHDPNSDEDLAMAKQVILDTEQNLAASVATRVAAGNALPEPTEEELAAAAATAAEAETAAAEAAAAETAAAEAAAGGEGEGEGETAASADLTSYLQTEVANLRTQLAAAQAETVSLNAELTQLRGVEEALRGPVIEHINFMCVATGMQAIPMDGLPPSTLASQYTAIKTKYDERFSFAGRQSVDGGEAAAKDEDVSTRARQAGLYPVK